MKFTTLIVICAAITITNARHHKHKSWHHQHKSWHYQHKSWRHQPAVGSSEDFQSTSKVGASSKDGGQERRFFTYCELKAIIEKEPWMEKNITDWMCLLHHESRFEKNVTGHRNDDGSCDYGPFQVSENWFCRGEHWGNFHFLKKNFRN